MRGIPLSLRVTITKYLEHNTVALISCPECAKDVSDKALSCPNCGYPIKIATPHEQMGSEQRRRSVPTRPENANLQGVPDSTAATTAARPKRPGIALALSLLFPG